MASRVPFHFDQTNRRDSRVIVLDEWRRQHDFGHRRNSYRQEEVSRKQNRRERLVEALTSLLAGTGMFLMIVVGGLALYLMLVHGFFTPRVG
jgi:hypothetical protein